MLSLLAAATLLFAPLAAAAPAPGINDATNINAPNRLCVNFCEDIYFKGYCKQICTTPGLCRKRTSSLTSGLGLPSVSSANVICHRMQKPFQLPSVEK